MKSKKGEKSKSSKSYPKLMVSFKYNFIILSTQSGWGTVVYSGLSEHKLGYFSTTWIIDDLIDFDSEVTLSN